MSYESERPEPGTGENKLPAFMSKQQLADFLGVSVRTVEQLMADGKLPFIRLTRKLVRFPTAETLDYFRRHLRVNARGEEGGVLG